MEKHISYCGIWCQACPIYWATREKNKEKKLKMRNEIARICNEQYKARLSPEDVSDCDGCKTNRRLFSGSSKCEIRECAKERKLQNCARCSDYACEKLSAFFTTDPQAKTNLDVIRSTFTE
jgi:hypothetical protein